MPAPGGVLGLSQRRDPDPFRSRCPWSPSRTPPPPPRHRHRHRDTPSRGRAQSMTGDSPGHRSAMIPPSGTHARAPSDAGSSSGGTDPSLGDPCPGCHHDPGRARRHHPARFTAAVDASLQALLKPYAARAHHHGRQRQGVRRPWAGGSRPRYRFLLRPAGPLLGTGLQRAHERSGAGSPGPRPPTSGLSPTSRFRPSRRPSTTGPARASPRPQRSTVSPPDPRGPCRTPPERLCSWVTRWGCRRAETRSAWAKDGVSRGSALARAPPSLRLIPGCCTSDWKRRFEKLLVEHHLHRTSP